LGQSISAQNTINIGYDTSCNASNTACIGNADISCVYLGSINGNAKLDCSGVVIGSQGITLDGRSNIPVPSSTINFNTVTYNGNCGRFDISGTITSGSSATQRLTNSAIKATSIVFVSVIPNAYVGVPVAHTYIFDIHDGYVNITLNNTTGSSYTSVPGQQEQIQFMIINPST